MANATNGTRRSAIQAFRRLSLPFLIACLIGGTFVLGLFTPLGIAVWLLYLLPLYCSYWSVGRFAPLVVAAAATVLTAVGLFLSPPGVPVWLPLLNRSLGTSIFWISALLLVRRKKTDAEISRRNWELKAGGNVLRAVAARSDLPSILQETLQGALDLTGLEGGTLCLVDHQSQTLHLAAQINVSPETVHDLTSSAIKIGDCLCGTCARTGQPLILWDNASGSEFATREAMRNEGIRFHAAFPLLAKGRCIGVLCVFAKSAAQPTERALDLVRDLCGPVALAIENARLHEAEREAARHWQAAFGAVGDAIFLLDPKQTIIRCNQAAFELVNKPAGEIVGRPCWEVVHDASAPPPECPVLRLGQTPQRESCELRVGPRWCHVAVDPVLDESGELSGVVHTLHDLTERKRAEEALRESEQRFRELAELLPQTVFEVDLEGRITFVNQRATETTGYTEAEFEAGLNCFEMLAPHEHDRARHNIQRVLAGEHLLGNDYTAQRKDGTQFPVVVYSTPILREDTPVGLRGIIVDITDRKRAEEALRSEAEFRRAIVHRAAEGLCVCHEVPDFPYVRFTLWNERMDQITGYTMDEINRRGWHQTVYPAPDLQAKAVARMARMREGCDLVSEEWEITRADGAKRQLLISTSVVQDSDGTSHVLALMHDITERKRAEQTLHALSLRQEAILAAVPDIIAEVDTNKTYTWMNQAGFDFFGADALGKEAAFYFAGEQDTYGAVQSLFNGDPSVIYLESWQRRRDGEARLLAWWCRALKDADGNVTGVLSTARDVTERKRTESVTQARLRVVEFAASHSPEELLTATLDELESMTGSQIGFFHFLEPDQRTISLQTWSTRTLREFCRAEGKGRHYDLDEAGVWVECVHQRRPVIHNDYAALPQKKGMPPGHARVIRELVVPIFRERKIVAILGVGNKPRDYGADDVELVSRFADMAWDVAERKRAERAARESEQRVRTILRTAMDGFWRVDPQGRLLEVNEAYCRMSGYSEQELLAMCVSDLEAAENPADVVAHIQEIMAQTEGRFETRHRRKDGTTYPVEVSVQYKLAEGGHMVVFLRDIADRKEAEDAFQRTQLQLAHMGRLTTAGELLAGIAHEVNQPLYAIANFAKACSNVLAQDKPRLDKVRQWNEEISAAAVRAGEIIKRLRFFLGRSETQRQPAGIREIIDESVALVAFETRRVGVTVCREFDDTNPEVYVDRLQIQQVMVNLLHNACEALEEKTGGARILTIRAAAAGEYVEVSVADNGSGLKAPEDPNIFEPFVTAKPEGLGMGLAISRTIVEAHGGRIWATANPKEGATFHFTLPGAGGGQSDVR